MYLSHNHRAATQVIKVGWMVNSSMQLLNLTSSRNENDLFLLGTIETEYLSSQKRQKDENTHQDLQNQPVPERTEQ